MKPGLNLYVGHLANVEKIWLAHSEDMIKHGLP